MFFFNSISRQLVFLPGVTKPRLTLFHVGARSLGARPVRTVHLSRVIFKKPSPESLEKPYTGELLLLPERLFDVSNYCSTGPYLRFYDGDECEKQAASHSGLPSSL